jgi:hypothetical protein
MARLERGLLTGLVFLGGAGLGYEVVHTSNDDTYSYGGENEIIVPDVTERPEVTMGGEDEAKEDVTKMAVKIVDFGDTWESIAGTFGLGVDELKRANTHIKSEEPEPMDMLCLPIPGTVCPKLK